MCAGTIIFNFKLYFIWCCIWNSQSSILLKLYS
nr:MAG TPA: hypothetical protein [Bacteriophage sp.]